jgi:hypothetical protein
MNFSCSPVTTPTLYLSSGASGNPLFALPQTAETLSATILALETAATWDDFQRLMPPTELARVKHAMRENDQRMPSGSKPFDPEVLPGFADGDWPAWIASTMLREVPEPVLQAFGQQGNSVLNGPMVEFRPEDLPAIKARLAELGWTVIERPDLRMDLEQ